MKTEASWTAVAIGKRWENSINSGSFEMVCEEGEWIKMARCHLQ